MAPPPLRSIKSGTRVFGRGEASVLHYSSRAINFLFEDTVVTLLTRNGALSPSSVIVDAGNFPLVRTARVTEDVFVTDAFRVVLGNFRDLGIQDRVPVDKRWVARTMAPFIFRMEKCISTALLMLTGREYELTGFEKVVAERQRQVLEQSDNFEKLAQRLLGLGFGLTPSGDDFVLGMIAMKRMFGEDVERLRPIIENYDNPFSRTILKNALDGYYSESVYAVLTSVMDGSLDKTHISRLLRVGSTSGHDTLAGMFYSLGLDSELCSNPHISDCHSPSVVKSCGGGFQRR